MPDNGKISRNVANLYQSIGGAYRLMFDFSNALNYLEESYNYFLIQENISKEELAGYAFNIAEAFYTSNQYTKAIQIINQYKEIADFENRISYYEILSFIQLENGNLLSAKRNYEEVLSLSEKGYKANSIYIAHLYLNYSNILISLKDFNLAQNYLSKAFAIIKETEPIFGETIAEYYRVSAVFATNKPIESNNKLEFNKHLKHNLTEEIDWYKKGLAALRYPENFSIDHLDDIDDVISLMSCIDFLKLIGDSYSDLAEIENSDYSTDKLTALSNAIINYQTVSILIQKSRKELYSDESKIQLSELENSTFYKLTKACYDTYCLTNDSSYIELAFQSSEQTKSSAVYDKISSDLAKENSLIPDTTVEKLNLLNSTITFYNERIFEENNSRYPDDSLLSEYGTKVLDADVKRIAFIKNLERDFPDYYELKYSSSSLSIKEIQSKMSEDEILIEYVFNETQESDENPTLHYFLIQKNNVEFQEIIIDRNFEKNIQSLFSFLSDKDFLNIKNAESVAFCKSSNYLYNKLLNPLKESLAHKKITIIPDGKINYIPFDALIESIPDTTKLIQFNRLDYCIKKYNFNYSNSANLLFKFKAPATKFNIKTIAFAPEYNNETFPVGPEKQLALAPLPGVQKEVDNIAKLVKTSIFKGIDASEKNFRKNVESFDILHLAMHAFINDSLPKYSRLAFSQNPQDEEFISEGWINTADIYNLNLNAKLTVLSACNTGIGQLKKGEGIMSLARGFQYAGCPAIIMSLWEVEDNAGTKIMSSFYKNFKSGKAKDESLREAKLEYLKSANSRQAHPHYWLSFVSIGDNSPLYKSYDFYFFVLLIIALSGIAIDQVIRMKKARKKRA